METTTTVDDEELPEDDPAFRGQVAYTDWNLRFEYDFFVLLMSNHLAWRCSTRSLMRWFEQHVSSNHLDVGVGTGFYPAWCRFPSPSPRLGLMDINMRSLRFASHRARRHRPEVYRRNVLAPIPFSGERFDSISLNFLLHCLPGSMAEKAVVFDNLADLLHPKGVIFGSTVLSGGVVPNRLARRFMRIYNDKGFFGNRQDSVRTLHLALCERFSQVELEIEGCVAKFAAWK